MAFPNKKPPVNIFEEFGKQLRQKNANPDINAYKPHPKQVQFHSANVRRRLFIGGNRSGKTVAGGVETIKVLTRKHEFIKWDPYTTIHGRGCAVDFLQGVSKIMVPMIARWLPPSELINGSWEDSYSKSARTLTLANGNDMEFLSYDQELEKFAGTSRHFIWYDEEPPKDIYDECQLRLLDTKGYSWATMTPIEGMTWIYDDLYLPGLDPNNPTSYTVEVSTDDNPNIDIKFAEENIFANLDEDSKKARRHGKFIQRAGLIYPHFSVANNVREPFIPPKEWLHAASLDHGLTNPTAWLWHAVDPSGNIWTYDEHYKSNMLIHEHADAVHEKNLSHTDGDDWIEPAYYIGDPSIKAKNPITGNSIQEEYASYGLYIGLGDNGQVAGLSRTRAYIEGVSNRKLFITSNCVNLIHELGRLRWATYQSKKITNDRNAKEEQHKKNDHAADSLRYFVMTRPELDTGTALPPPPEIGFGTMVMADQPKLDTNLRKKTKELVDPHMGAYI